MPHRLGFGLVDHQLPVADVISERQRAAHPHASAFGCSDLVADALAGDLPLELREGQQHVQRQPTDRSRCVEVLRNGDERDAMGVEDLDQLGEVRQRAGQPIDLVDDHQIDPARTNVGK